MPGTRKLGRVTAHRNSMLRGMVTYLLENGSIETTLTRAKEVRCMAEKMITLGKKNNLAARRAAMAYITKEDVVKKLFDIIAPEYKDREGGYTRTYKLGPRRGDGAEMALIKLVAEEKSAADLNKKKRTTKKKDAETVEDAAAPVEEATAETSAEAEKAAEKPAKAAKTTKKPAMATKAAKKPSETDKAAEKPAKKAKAETKPAADTAEKKPAKKAKAEDTSAAE